MGDSANCQNFACRCSDRFLRGMASFLSCKNEYINRPCIFFYHISEADKFLLRGLFSKSKASKVLEVLSIIVNNKQSVLIFLLTRFSLIF